MAPRIKSLLAAALLALAPTASAIDELVSDSLSTCQDNSQFSATMFEVSLTPSNASLTFGINGVSTISGYVILYMNVFAYGLNVYSKEINPCELSEFKGMCPMQEGQITLPLSNAPIPPSALSAVPGITYTVPNLDASFQITFNDSKTGEGLACVEAQLSNGKTVDQKAVAWVLAVTSGLALVSSAITSGLGHSNTAAHVAANALSLFGYFQAQAFIGMTAVELPPIVSAWTQNFQWSMGIIRVGFLQDIATWYQRATGGTPSLILSDQGTYSVQVEKRHLNSAYELVKRGVQFGHQLMKRQSSSSTEGSATNPIIVRGIQRVGFNAGIEPTNIFLTGYMFFVIFVVGVILGVVAFKYICEALVKSGHMQSNKFQDFRNGWTTVLKGIMYRIVLIGFPQMVVLCFWEFTRDDSGAEIVLAIFTIFTMIGILGWASSKVIRLARRSIAMHKNPAYILYSDPIALNKWGFLYVQFKATAYYFIVPILIYVFIKGLLIAFGQGSGVAQAIGLVIVEAAYLIGISIMTPYMDKKTNAFNISISVINFISAIFLLVFSDVFGQPGIVTGVMGVVFFVYNAAFSTVLLIIVLVASYFALASKNPDVRYQPMRDDRGSFIKSQSALTTELDALGATARGESKHGYTSKSGARIEDDEDSLSSGGEMAQNQPTYNNQPSYTNYYPSDAGHERHNRPTYQTQHSSQESYSRGAYQQQRPSQDAYNRPTYQQQSSQESYRSRSTRSVRTNPNQYRAQNTSSPWQRGAGYD